MGSSHDRRRSRRAAGGSQVELRAGHAESINDPYAKLINDPKERPWRDYALFGGGLLAEFLALKYGAAWLAWCAALAFGLAAYDLTKVLTKRFKYTARFTAGLVILCGTLAVTGEAQQLLRLVRNTVRDPAYVPPKGPAIRVDESYVPPSSQLCRGLSDEAEIECLCPRPLNFSLKSLPPPTDTNYATELTILAVREPIYRLRVFSRTYISNGTLSETWPYGLNDAVNMLGMFDYDRFTIVIHSSAPQKRYRAVLHTAEGLRIKCVNQEN